MAIILFLYVVQKMIQLIWGMLILMLLLLSVIVPGAFLGVLVVFYVPIIVGLLYMICELLGSYWVFVILVCLFLFLI